MSKVGEFVYNVISKFVPVHKEIYLESKPIFADNTYRLYLEMLKKGINKKYKLIWIYDNYDQQHNVKIPDKLPHNVSIIKINNESYIGRLRKKYFMARGKVYISCNYYYGGQRKEQFNLHLNHGAPFKDAGKNNKVSPWCSKEIALSKYLLPFTAKDTGLSKQKIIVTGFPRNDFLIETSPQVVKSMKFFSKYEKIFVWMPTFRQSWYKGREDSPLKFKFGIPIISNLKELREINDVLKRNNDLLVIKIHFAQNVKYIKEVKLSNIVFLSNEDLSQMGLQLYEFLAGTDGLITDYSSIYFDYLLLNKPIGLTVDDMDTYMKYTGIVYDNYYDFIKGTYIKNKKDLVKFLIYAAGNPKIDNKNNKIISRYNDFYDNKSSQRILNYLISKKVI